MSEGRDPISQAQGLTLKTVKHKTVAVKNPDGRLVTVPASKEKEYLARDGWKKAKASEQPKEPADDGDGEGNGGGEEITAETINKMKTKDLEAIVAEFDLDIDLDSLPNIAAKREAIIASLELEG